LNLAESLFPGEGDDSFADIINGKVEGLATDKIRAWLTRMAVNPTTSPRGAVFFNGQYQPLDEVSRVILAGEDMSPNKRLSFFAAMDRSYHARLHGPDQLSDAASELSSLLPGVTRPRSLTTRPHRASSINLNRFPGSIASSTICPHRLPEEMSTSLWESLSDRRPSWILAKYLAPTR
jgi:hypothetical protein